MATIRKRVRASAPSMFRFECGDSGARGDLPESASAERWAKTVEAEMIEGRHFRNVEARRRNLAGAIDRYVADEVPKKRNGGMYAFTMPWWKKNLGHLRLSEVTPAVLVETGGSIPSVSSPELKMALERFARLEGEKKRLTAENQQLPGQFARWARCDEFLSESLY